MDLKTVEAEVLALAEALRRRGWHLASAESCTGGLIAAACTAVAGSSDWFERGYVTYSNAAKAEMLGVDLGLIASHGAVSEAVVQAMALGAVQRASVELGVAVTGIAGPGGATPGKPVGTVWLAVAARVDGADIQVRAERLQLAGDRNAVREQTVRQALWRLREAAS
ncbi:MAG: damage-inducible protein CinA [Proteobacteria bacterium]|nr:damage-inducible protein CinA [Pseudomonadota bacterium]